MRKALLIAVVLLLATAASWADYSGSLTTDLSQITANGDVWGSGTVTIDWTITDLGGGWLEYSYTLTTPEGGAAPSHFIIEVSDNFTEADISNLQGTTTWSVGTFDSSNGNPSIPEGFYGLKFDDLSGETSVTVSFETLRQPVWGDFYAKCGGSPPDVNTAWNEGFSVSDPLDLPTNGTIANHLLVPDTIIPEPGTLALLAPVLLGGGVWLRRRKK
jgi:hypothetical protein